MNQNYPFFNFGIFSAAVFVLSLLDPSRLINSLSSLSSSES